MPLDLKTSNNFISSRGVLIERDHLLILESQGMSSRLWRVPFDQVTRVVATRRIPWLKLIFLPMLPALPGLIFILAAIYDTPRLNMWMLGLGAICMLIAAAVIFRYLFYRRTDLTIDYGRNKQRQMSFIARPRKIKDFLTRLTQNIRADQELKWQARQADESQEAPPAL